VSLAEQIAGEGPGSGPPPADPETDSARRRRRFRWWWLLPPLALAIAAVTILSTLAATYQPVAFGAVSGANMIVGMQQGTGLRWVNRFGGSTGDIYVPPQRSTFTVSASITNTGTHAVTIESVSLPHYGGRYWPFVPAGPAHYNILRGGPQHPHILRNVTLRPGDQMEIAFPVRATPCREKYGWTDLDHFLVRERFLFFTHTVSLPFIWGGGRLIMHTPQQDPSEQSVVCLASNRAGE